MGAGNGKEKANIMKCVICKHGETKPGTTTITLERDNTMLIFKAVPAEVCANCGEAYVTEQVTSHLLSVAEEATRAGVQTEIRAYASVV